MSQRIEYRDENGAIAYVIDRVEFQAGNGVFVLKDGKRKKEFRQRRPDPDHPGEWLYNVDGVTKVPYRLPELIEAVASQQLIFIVEGEGKVDALREIGIVATCNPGGAGKWQPEMSERLRGADVVLLPDNDEPGWKHVQRSWRLARRYHQPHACPGAARSVRRKVTSATGSPPAARANSLTHWSRPRRIGSPRRRRRPTRARRRLLRTNRR